MKPKYLIPALAVLCATAYAEDAPSAPIVTDPAKIVESTTYDLGDRLMTIQEITKEGLPMPEVVTPPPVQARSAPNPEQTEHREFGYLNLGGSVYCRPGKPARTLITYRPQGSDQSFSFWTSADWRLIAGTGSLTDRTGKIWQLMLAHSVLVDPDPAIEIPEFPAGASTIHLVSGNPTPEQLAPVKLFLAHYDANHTELLAAFDARTAEQERLAAEALANPKPPEDIVVQFRILAPEEIVAPKTSGN